MKPIGYLILMGLIIYFILIGLHASPLAFKQDFQVQAEYLSGMLTANGILFAFWAIVIERKPQKKRERWIFEHIFAEVFFIPFFLFALSTMFVFLTALDVFSSAIALGFCFFSFYINAIGITIILYYERFKA